MAVSEIQIPPQQNDGRVSVKDFWDAVTMEILSCGFHPSKLPVYSVLKQGNAVSPLDHTQILGIQSGEGMNPFIVHPGSQTWVPRTEE